ncbi:ABC transporter permease subunit [Conexibacter sp. W3-3-2]|uniref:ABC transporter permease n=1 Tax=Conexibacter sp. W3-3-2 TaxID=2675227 RepID=UPI0012B8C387|nr:ABC transporter permease [Conexibacter sp. W3-3-2]MTD45276.1 ABC transporter permease subunit [Conexibacter sp. W3-3-2]
MPERGGATWLVARREIVERGRERSFLVSTVLSVVILIAVVVVPSALGLDGPSKQTLAVTPDVPAALVTQLQARADAYDVELTVDRVADVAAARAAVSDGDADAALTDRGATLSAEQDPDDDLALLVQTTARDLGTASALRERGADAAEVRRILDPSPVRTAQLDPGGDDAAAAGVAFVVVLLLYFQLIGYGNWVASGVVEEKSSRVVELLLSTVRPWQLLAGKILGIGALGLVQLLGMAGLGVGVAAVTGAVELPDATLPAILAVLPWFLLGYAFYATVFALLAATVARQEDLQSATGPMNLVLMAAFFASFAAQSDPEGGVARIASLLPPSAPLVMPSRIVQDAAATWEIALSVGLMLAAIAVVVPLAGRIYAGGALRTGKRASLRETWRAARA